MVYEVIDLLVVVLPIIIAVLSVWVGIELAKGKSLGFSWPLIIAAGVMTSVLALISQHHANKQHETEVREQKQAALRLQTKLAKIEIEGQFLASSNAVLPRVWNCLPLGDENNELQTEAVDLRHSSRRSKNHCPPQSPNPLVTVTVGLCKARETCHNVRPPDLAADFAKNKEQDCVRVISDKTTSRLRIIIDCQIPKEVRPYLANISLSDIRAGSLRIGINAKKSLEFPNPDLLTKADLESVTVTLNGVAVKLEAKDFVKSSVDDGFEYLYDLKPQDLGSFD